MTTATVSDMFLVVKQQRRRDFTLPCLVFAHFPFLFSILLLLLFFSMEEPFCSRLASSSGIALDADDFAELPPRSFLGHGRALWCCH